MKGGKEGGELEKITTFCRVALEKNDPEEF